MKIRTLLSFGALIFVFLLLKLACNLFSLGGPILENDERSAQIPALNYKGDKIAFVFTHRNDPNKCGFYLVDPNGNNLQPIIQNVNSKQVPKHFTWSPDGDKIAFTIANILYLYKLPENKIYEIMPGFLPAWSASGTKIAFISPDEQQIAYERRFDRRKSYYGEEDDNSPSSIYDTVIVKKKVFKVMTYDLATGSVSDVYQTYTNKMTPGKMGWVTDDRITVVLDSLVENEPGNIYVSSKNYGWTVKDIDCNDRTATDVMFIPKDLEKMEVFGLSPDCQKLLFQRGEAVWLADLESNALDKVLETKLGNPSWGMNGKTFYYSLNGKIWCYNIETKECSSIAETKHIPPQLSSDGKKIVFAMSTPSGDELADAEGLLQRLYVIKIK